MEEAGSGKGVMAVVVNSSKRVVAVAKGARSHGGRRGAAVEAAAAETFDDTDPSRRQ